MDPVITVRVVLKSLSENATAIDVIRQIAHLTGKDHPKTLYVLSEVINLGKNTLDQDVIRQLKMLMNEGLVHLIAEEIYAVSKPKCCGLL